MNEKEFENGQWLDSLHDLIQVEGKGRAKEILDSLFREARELGVLVQEPMGSPMTTPYLNTIPLSETPAYPGDEAIEKRIRSIVRWNAMAMVVRSNRLYDGIGGHISTYASAATLYEVAFNHIFHAKNTEHTGDQIYFQGHASPGIYARAYLEGRIALSQLQHFRREIVPGQGLSSYPHPWLMPNFWQFPSVSMGLAPISAIYQARFNRYLQHRGIKDTSQSHVWCYVGDGETDEPESLGALSLAGREGLDNLTFVINCNLQRLDGPVRGNGKIIQELETVFKGAGWNVIKVIWGSRFEPIIAKDRDGLLQKRMNEAVDGEYQKYSVETGAYIREHFFGKYPKLLELVTDLSDTQLERLNRGGHDPQYVYAAYQAALACKGKPTVILAKTVKGYGLGEAGEGKNITHSQKTLNEEELRHFRDRFDIPIQDSDLPETPFYKPDPKSPEIEYLLERRRALGGCVPQRTFERKTFVMPPARQFDEFNTGSKDRAVSTTMAFNGVFAKLLRDPALGRCLVPIIPDEARTFGMESLFRQIGIYSSLGQQYEPVDIKTLTYYREATDGQMLEEGISEAGAVASFTAAATSYATFDQPMIPFYIYYSMFGFQRTGDLMWALGDIRARGFLLGATSGRTTLIGEGLQHADGHSLLLSSAYPRIRSYDPAFAFEIAALIQRGLHEMYVEEKDLVYYLTLGNENYAMPPMPGDVTEGILRGLYCFRPATSGEPVAAQLFGSGAIINQVLEAQQILADEFGIATNVWSATSYSELAREAMQCERWNRLHPTETPRIPYVVETMADQPGPVIATSDYVMAVPNHIARCLPNKLYTLGTDGLGRSDTRETLRRFFEVDAPSIVVATLHALMEQGTLDREEVAHAIELLAIDPDKADPFVS